MHKKQMATGAVALFGAAMASVVPANSNAQMAVYAPPLYAVQQPGQQQIVVVPNHGVYAQPYQYNGIDTDGYYRPMQPQIQRAAPNYQVYQQQPAAVVNQGYYQAPQAAQATGQYQDNDNGYYADPQASNYEDYYYDY